jgi:hypothetical protein
MNGREGEGEKGEKDVLFIAAIGADTVDDHEEEGGQAHPVFEQQRNAGALVVRSAESSR